MLNLVCHVTFTQAKTDDLSLSLARDPIIKKIILGTNGLYEAIYHSVPMLGLPLLVDQFDNMLRVTERGAGLTLDITKINEDDLFFSIQR